MVAIRNAELFEAGKWNGKSYTEKDLDQIAANFEEHQSPRSKKRMMRVGLVKDHVSNSGPKFGTITRLFREGRKLLFDAEEIDPAVAEEIKTGRFGDLSAELYQEAPEGIHAKGMMLRRVALLGAEPPKIKGLNPDGLAKRICYAERRPMVKITRISRRGSAYECFSEDVPLGRDELIKRLTDAGMSLDETATLDDVQLSAIVRTLDGNGSSTMQANPSGEESAPPPEQNQPTGDNTVEKTEPPTEGKPSMNGEKPDATVIPQENDQDSDNMPDDQEAARKMYGEMKAKCKKFAENFGKKFGGAAQLEDVNTTGSSSPATGFSEGQIEKALANVIAEGRAQIDRELASSRNELKRQRIELFCELERNTGRIEPADFDKSHGGPNIVDRLLALDDKDLVHKFTEGGEEKQMTALDAELRAIRARPVKYTPNKEKIHSAVKKPAETFAEGSPAARKAAFQSFAESKAEVFALTDTTPKEIIEAWENAGTEENRRDLERDLGFPGA